jgi:Kef-type K+ transport system membrane component KefB
VGLLGTGVALALIPKTSIDPWVFAHKAFFVVWFVAMTIHVLLHLTGTVRAVAGEYFSGRASLLPGWLTRQAVLVIVLVVGIALGSWSIAYSHGWGAFM